MKLKEALKFLHQRFPEETFVKQSKHNWIVTDHSMNGWPRVFGDHAPRKTIQTSQDLIKRAEVYASRGPESKTRRLTKEDQRRRERAAVRNAMHDLEKAEELSHYRPPYKADRWIYD